LVEVTLLVGVLLLVVVLLEVGPDGCEVECSVEP
jgi:hypothetical protein